MLITELDGMYLANDFPVQGRGFVDIPFGLKYITLLEIFFVAVGLKRENSLHPGLD